ncbi:MAG: hypothetical protein E7605_08030 [Ruminococcaceae bacterium]|nr:hypothetical protein [Oscillospiraceae bacterium]
MKQKNAFRAIVIVLALAMLMSATACNLLPDPLGEAAVTRLVQGNLDTLYLGEFSKEYMELVHSSEQELQDLYMEGIVMEAEYFAWYWGIIDTDADETLEHLDKQLRQNIIDLYIKISDQAKYEVESAVKMNDGSYTVKVWIQPIMIMEQALEVYEKGSYQPLEDYRRKSQNVDWENISSQEYWAMTNEYGQIIVDMVVSLLPTLGHDVHKSMVIQVAEDEDGYLQINGDDLGTFNSYVVTYP